MEENKEQIQDATNEFIKGLRAHTITFDPTLNPNPKAKMFKLNEIQEGQAIPRGGVILKSDDQIGSKYYSESDLMTAIAEFSEKISQEQETTETQDEETKNKHVVTKTKKVDMKAFAEMVSKATKVYLSQNNEITNQDARIVSKDIENEGTKEIKNAGGIFAGKAGSELENEAYIDAEAVKVAVREFIETKIITVIPPIIPIPIPDNGKGPGKKGTEGYAGEPINTEIDEPKVDSEQEENGKEKETKHIVTANKGKIQKHLKKAIIATLVTIALMTSLKSCEAQKAYIPTDPQIDYVEIVDEKEKQLEKQVEIAVNEAFENGMGQEVALTDNMTYLRDPRIATDAQGQNAVKVSEQNIYAKPGDTVTVNGISINDKDGKTIASEYDKEGDKNLSVKEFVQENSPDQDAEYKVFAHIKSDTTDLGWIRIGGAETQMQEAETQKGYYIVSTQEGEIIGIIKSDGEPKNIDDLKPIEQAPKDIQEEANEKIAEVQQNGIEI